MLTFHFARHGGGGLPIRVLRAALKHQVAAGRAALLDAFFAVTGRRDEPVTRQGEADFVAALHRWTDDVAANLDAQDATLVRAILARLSCCRGRT